MKTVADLMVCATFLGAVVFVTVYVRRQWRTTGIGINLMALGVVIIIESGLALLAVAFGVHWPYRDLIRAIAWFLITAVMWHRVILILRIPDPGRPRSADELLVEREQALARVAEIDTELLRRGVEESA